MKKVLITGVAGFVGSHVARRFLEEKYQVIGIDDLSGGKSENVPSRVDFINGDLTQSETIALIPEGCETILHLAGQSSGEMSFDNPITDLQKNTVSTLNLIRYGIQNNSKRIVYASSMSVYGSVPDKPIDEHHDPKPLSCYGVGKLAAEGYLRIYQDQLPFVALRMFNVYGPGQDLSNLRQGMVSIYMAQALSEGHIEVKGSIERFRDFIYIDDVVEAWWRSATYPGISNRIINIGTGKRTTVHALLDKICAEIPGCDFFIQGATPGDQSGIYAYVGELNKMLGLSKFTELDTGLHLFVTWAREQINGKI
ncbi:MAG: NAD-dependent epimerase/dehydratase family protein [Proteobacteria bacterium]|nr:NAD-dependent epimerase/dehydratase family protein [Pseudomonadota bacterium]MBU1627168.1 NAD-dependent epimerase/dehydratase family protein [bacterium]